MLSEKIKNKESGIILYGITPPKKGTDPAKVKEIADLQKQRLLPLNVDGLVIYDIQDEETRTQDERPFPFMETLDAFEYGKDYLQDLSVQQVIYRAVGKYSKPELSHFIETNKDNLSVFVGAASKSQSVSMKMNEAYELKKQTHADSLMGGVVISERHDSKKDEHLRVFKKIEQGCSFFISQGVYDVEASKNFLSDYYYHAKANNLELAPILFTLTPCGSAKTLQFMKWLGISIPRWLENELLNSGDILQTSVDYSEKCFKELKEFADNKGITIGCNIESVSVRKVEIEASIDLVKRIQGIKASK
ncbi:methylenetetrahydrofolate reductase [Marinicellulosiphila megalodicopiae]|uniref:methylenetetrahydrofolate reductase n=1 Tax=Marinicellulosiphila megalodicopiae TaxID=2724896 RepID=UPI003BAF4E42